ncbi:hypothetical protein VTK26DRAFT_7327 [Humicola hyalothermophila]
MSFECRNSQSESTSPLSDSPDDTSRRHHARFDHSSAAVAGTETPNSAVDDFAAAPVASSDPTCIASRCTASVRPVQFQSHTVAPSPPPSLAPVTGLDADCSAQSTEQTYTSANPIQPQTQPCAPLTSSPPQVPEDINGLTTPSKHIKRPALTLQNKSSAQSLHPLSRTPSLKASSLYGHFGSTSAASSTVPSPVISAMGDVTPLPSPLLASDSPGPWKQLGRPSSRDNSFSHPTPHQIEPQTPARPPRNTNKVYAGLSAWPPLPDGPKDNQESRLAKPTPTHTRNRSISEYIPDPMVIPKRTSTMSGVCVRPEQTTLAEPHLRRERHLSEARGLTPIEKPPTPPPSESSISAVDSFSAGGPKQSRPEFFEAYGRYDKKRRRWRALRVLGQGTFSQVVLATSQISTSLSDDEDSSSGATLFTPESGPPRERRSLVAVKICEHGPQGGASEDRIEMSLKRELEIMQDILHPSLVNLKAWNIEPSRAILVLSYYPGGDLFDVATAHRKLLTAPLIRRIFSELVGAVTYLHDKMIVHRDIKLENVLVNLPPAELASATTDWTKYPHPVVTLTDLGLSRRVSAPEERLETRCGSDDYAAPEIVMGQPYDGRATDAWSLGVLLYALLEARLPFDPPPAPRPGPYGDGAAQVRMRSRTSHRIARVEWRWYEFGVRDEEGEEGEGEGEHEADPKKFEAKGLTGAMEVVEGLLKRARSRWPLEKVKATEWVAGGVAVEGGIRMREEEEGEEV